MTGQFISFDSCLKLDHIWATLVQSLFLNIIPGLSSLIAFYNLVLYFPNWLFRLVESVLGMHTHGHENEIFIEVKYYLNINSCLIKSSLYVEKSSVRLCAWKQIDAFKCNAWADGNYTQVYFCMRRAKPFKKLIKNNWQVNKKR